MAIAPACPKGHRVVSPLSLSTRNPTSPRAVFPLLNTRDRPARNLVYFKRFHRDGYEPC